jgi:hypothetical protein
MNLDEFVKSTSNFIVAKIQLMQLHKHLEYHPETFTLNPQAIFICLPIFPSNRHFPVSPKTSLNFKTSQKPQTSPSIQILFLSITSHLEPLKQPMIYSAACHYADISSNLTQKCVMYELHSVVLSLFPRLM